MPTIYRIINSLLSTNTYIYALDNKNCLVIDPGSDFDTLLSKLEEINLLPLAVLATHGHFDHIAGVTQLREKHPDCGFYLHEKDVKTMKLSNFMMKIFKLEGKINIPEPHITFNDSSGYKIGEKEILFFHAPGHTLGSCVIKIDNNLFTGDTLFYSHVSSKIPNESLKMLQDSQMKVCNAFSADMNIFPGHGDAGLLNDAKEKLTLSR